MPCPSWGGVGGWGGGVGWGWRIIAPHRRSADARPHHLPGLHQSRPPIKTSLSMVCMRLCAPHSARAKVYTYSNLAKPARQSQHASKFTRAPTFAQPARGRLHAHKSARAPTLLNLHAKVCTPESFHVAHPCGVCTRQSHTPKRQPHEVRAEGDHPNVCAEECVHQSVCVCVCVCAYIETETLLGASRRRAPERVRQSTHAPKCVCV